MSVLDIRDVTKKFGTTVTAVDSFNLTVGDGELVCLLGPSGSGKSTLLRMVGGFETPDQRQHHASTARRSPTCRPRSGRPAWCSRAMRSGRT